MATLATLRSADMTARAGSASLAKREPRHPRREIARMRAYAGGIDAAIDLCDRETAGARWRRPGWGGRLRPHATDHRFSRIGEGAPNSRCRMGRAATPACRSARRDADGEDRLRLGSMRSHADAERCSGGAGVRTADVKPRLSFAAGVRSITAAATPARQREAQCQPHHAAARNKDLGADVFAHHGHNRTPLRRAGEECQ